MKCEIGLLFITLLSFPLLELYIQPLLSLIFAVPSNRVGRKDIPAPLILGLATTCWNGMVIIVCYFRSEILRGLYVSCLSSTSALLQEKTLQQAVTVPWGFPKYHPLYCCTTFCHLMDTGLFLLFSYYE